MPVPSEELLRWAAIYGSIVDVIFLSIVPSLAPEEDLATLLKQRITRVAEASIISWITASVAVASTLQLVRRDMVLDHFSTNLL